MTLLLRSLTKYADFTGRANRAEFWLFFVIAMVIVPVIAHLVDRSLGDNPPVFLRFGMVELVTFLLLLLPLLTVGARRLHDTGRSGWWMLLMYIPYLGWSFAIDNSTAELLSLGGFGVGFTTLMVLFALPGDPGPNLYGDPPATATVLTS